MVCLHLPSSALGKIGWFVISHLINCVTALTLPEVCFGNERKNCSAPSPKNPSDLGDFCLQSECLLRAHLVKGFIGVVLCLWGNEAKPELYRIQESQS